MGMRGGGWRRAGAAALGLVVVAGCSLFRRAEPPPVVGGVQAGVASWYGPGFHGRPTASGEVFDQHELTAAHPSLPLGTRAMVTNLENGRAVEVRINDRGPFVDGRVIDLSYAAARSLGMIGPGTARVRIEVLGRVPMVAAAAPPPRRVPPAPRDVPEASYAIEVAALSDPSRAEHLRGVLARRFPDAFVSPVPNTVGRYYRVRVGPYPLRTVAQQHAERLARLGYPAIIVEEPRR